MYLLLSGEGKGDIGQCNPPANSCDCNFFEPGPMSWMVDELIQFYQKYEYSYLEYKQVSYVSESYLVNRKPRPSKRSMSLRGKKKEKETQYYYQNARALAIVAKEKETEVNDVVIAVLFRDSDGTASAGRGDWEHKRKSMIRGFSDEGFDFGVPMIPKPKSEAWLLCAVKEDPYQVCDKLENESGNDKSKKPLKKQLSDALKGRVSTMEINEMVKQGKIDVHKIMMPSFEAFKDSFERCLKNVHQTT